jgi:hypothetical protein
MAFWKRPRSLQDRFPADRLAALPLAVYGAAEVAATKHGCPRGSIANTKFWLGYLAGFPEYLDDVDQHFGGVIRKLIFDQIWGEAEGQLRFARALVLVSDGDEQARRGFGFGVPDGSRFFEAIEQGRSAEGALMGVATALELDMVDFNQTIS